MPNMLMSTALAYYYLYKQTNNESNLEKGEKLLEEALLKFPALLMDLLDKCNVMPDKNVESNWIFSRVSHLK
jgi:hypothetical protein